MMRMLQTAAIASVRVRVVSQSPHRLQTHFSVNSTPKRHAYKAQGADACRLVGSQATPEWDKAFDISTWQNMRKIPASAIVVVKPRPL